MTQQTTDCLLRAVSLLVVRLGSKRGFRSNASCRDSALNRSRPGRGCHASLPLPWSAAMQSSTTARSSAERLTKMAGMIVTNCDVGSIALRNEVCRDELLAAPGAKTYLAGTILARRSVAQTVAVVSFVGSGKGTLSAATVVPGTTVPTVGAYTLKCTAAVADGGVFSLYNPSGALVSSNLTMSPGAGLSTVFKASGLQFTITDGSTDFAVGDTATLTVAADGKLVAFDPTNGYGGAQTPYAVLQYQLVASGAGNIPCRPIISGEVNRPRLIIDADGSGVNVTDTVVQQLRERLIIATDVAQLARLDN